jgi:group II intron reverse transcriptase/maturase
MEVGEKQKNISQMATADHSLKFHNLYDLIHHPSWLETAYQHVRQNAGSKTAGVDKVTMLLFEENLESNLQELSEQLKSGTFDPFPVRRVILKEKKRDGRMKFRALGIPAIRDRIVQEALRMILEPIWESDFSTYSYGFRPNRCTMDAVSYLWAKMIGTAGWAYKWVIEGDISSYFDTIHHRKLMKLLQKRIKEKKLLDLIWKFLQAGVLDGGNYAETLSGVPQGGIVSPLLANIYLHELDKYMEDTYVSRSQIVKHRNRKKGIPNFLYTRYADDFVVLCDGNKAR